MSSTVLINPTTAQPETRDCYGLFRSEGRILINIGFGLAELGYDVNIVDGNFNTFLYEYSKGKIRISKSPVHDKYDFRLTWSRIENSVNVKKEVCIVNYTHELKGIYQNISNDNHDKFKLVCPYLPLIDVLNKEIENEIPFKTIEYLPQINPIPSYNLGFKDFNFNSNKKIVNIFVYVSSWSRNALCMDEFSTILDRLSCLLTMKNKHIKLWIQINEEDIKRDCKTILKYGDEVEFVGTMRYDNYLHFIEKMDMFLLKGSQHIASAGMYDIISLGKPIIYVCEEINQSQPIRNPLLQVKKELIFRNDNKESITRKVNNFIKNPEISYQKFRECIEDSSFHNWKKFAFKTFK